MGFGTGQREARAARYSLLPPTESSPVPSHTRHASSEFCARVDNINTAVFTGYLAGGVGILGWYVTARTRPWCNASFLHTLVFRRLVADEPEDDGTFGESTLGSLPESEI
jgi:hypothetical protein